MPGENPRRCDSCHSIAVRCGCLGMFSVSCMGCGLHTDIFSTEQAAVDAWNRRAILAVDSQTSTNKPMPSASQIALDFSYSEPHGGPTGHGDICWSDADDGL
jgi:hypothetical protein